MPHTHAEALRAARTSQGLTIIELAVRAGVSKGVIERLEHAPDRATLERTSLKTLRRVADALGCRMEEVFPGLIE